MKLLGWMHQRKWQNSIEPFKDFTTGNYCSCLSAQSTLNDQENDSNPSFGSRYGARSSKQPGWEYENSISELEAKQVDRNFNEEISMVISDPFHGFLTIGTLGIISEPPTPTFSMPSENVTEEKIDVVDYNLKLVNDELEKFLEAEAEEEETIELSGRHSYVSIITLSDNPLERINSEDHGKMMVCPLQGYLFGSIEFPETITEEKKEKASLGELLHRTKITEESSMETNGNGEIPAKTKHKSVKNLMKKMLKKFHASSKSTIPSYSNTTYGSTKKKLHKVIQMFHRKVHPENSIAKKELKSRDNKSISNLYDGDRVERGSGKGNRSYPLGSKSMDQIQYKTSNKLAQYGLREVHQEDIGSTGSKLMQTTWCWSCSSEAEGNP